MPLLMRISYKEPHDPEWEEPYMSVPYERRKAETLIPVLKKMGCVDIKLVPARERPRKKKLDKTE